MIAWLIRLTKATSLEQGDSLEPVKNSFALNPFQLTCQAKENEEWQYRCNLLLETPITPSGW